jgi:hypothetical protein
MNAVRQSSYFKVLKMKKLMSKLGNPCIIRVQWNGKDNKYCENVNTNNAFLIGQLKCQEVVFSLSLNKKEQCLINSLSKNEKRFKEKIHF